MAEAQTLNRSQKLKAVGSSVKKRPLKTVLCNPYNPAWPTIEKRNQEEIIMLLQRHCSVPMVEGKQRDVLLGMNKVTRSLDHDLLSLVIVDRSAPWQLHRHLISLCAVRECPAGAVDGLAAALCPVLGVTRLSVIGFKKHFSPHEDIVTAEQETLKLVNTVNKLLPSIHLPWLEFSKSLLTTDIDTNTISQSTTQETSSADNCQPILSTGEQVSKLVACQSTDTPSIENDKSTITECVTDSSNTGKNVFQKVIQSCTVSKQFESEYAHLYVYKADKLAEKKTCNLDFLTIQVLDNSSSDEEETCLWVADSGMNRRGPRKGSSQNRYRRTPNRTASKRDKTPASGYKRTNIGRMQGKDTGVKKVKKTDKKSSK